ncbi:hypothetical protein D3C78_1391610 [compost metagenome]
MVCLPTWFTGGNCPTFIDVDGQCCLDRIKGAVQGFCEIIAGGVHFRNFCARQPGAAWLLVNFQRTFKHAASLLPQLPGQLGLKISLEGTLLTVSGPYRLCHSCPPNSGL